ncbi:MAG: tryptophan synthase subunit alpha [Proteobacteria bacterium]|nr:tryptophan synthase subunit alpha [Pseudomonadota bacterium]
MERIERRFAALRAAGRGGLIAFISAGDPDPETSMALLEGLPGAGADLIELGVPFTDPMADGPIIQAGSQRALKAGASTRRTLEMVRRFREADAGTPIVLMGYYNPLYVYGPERFSRDAAAAGVDGLIVVDLPPEEGEELRLPAEAAGLALVMLATPTTDERRLPAVLAHAGGFIYYVSITGITGTRSAAAEAVRAALVRLRHHTALPVAVGFGIREPAQAAEVARVADAAVVGSALVERVARNLDAAGRAKPGLVADVLALVGGLAAAVKGARRAAAAERARPA